MHLDVTKKPMARMCGGYVDVYGGLNILVNNAELLEHIDYDSRGLATATSDQLDGVFLGVKYAIPAMIESGNAHNQHFIRCWNWGRRI